MSLGLVDVQRLFRFKQQHKHLRVFIGGRDITNVVRWVNDETNEAEVLVRDENDKIQLNEDGELTTEILRGTVQFLEVQKKSSVPSD